MNTPESTPPKTEIELLREQNAALTKENAQLSLRPPVHVDEKLIREKMKAGLTREQAISAIGNHRAFAKRFAELKPVSELFKS